MGGYRRDQGFDNGPSGYYQCDDAQTGCAQAISRAIVPKGNRQGY